MPTRRIGNAEGAENLMGGSLRLRLDFGSGGNGGGTRNGSLEKAEARERMNRTALVVRGRRESKDPKGGERRRGAGEPNSRYDTRIQHSEEHGDFREAGYATSVAGPTVWAAEYSEGDNGTAPL
jgi:hypothetical protein